MEEVRKGGKWIEEGGTCMCREGGRKYGWVEIKQEEQREGSTYLDQTSPVLPKTQGCGGCGGWGW